MSHRGLKIVTWNLRWAKPQSPRGKLIDGRLQEAAADIICLTEAFSGNLPQDGGIAAAATGNSYADRIGGKKSLIWSRFGWKAIKTGDGIMPPGRFVSGTAQTPAGLLRVMGICIPWRDSNVGRFGNGECSRWEDHLTFIKGLADELASSDLPTIVLGDFNQRIPRASQPHKITSALEACLTGLVVATSGFGSSEGSLSIDHIAHTPDLTTDRIEEIPATIGAIELSDHFGVMAEVHSAA